MFLSARKWTVVFLSVSNIRHNLCIWWEWSKILMLGCGSFCFVSFILDHYSMIKTLYCFFYPRWIEPMACRYINTEVREVQARLLKKYKRLKHDSMWTLIPTAIVFFLPLTTTQDDKKAAPYRWVQRRILAPHQHHRAEWCNQWMMKPLLGTHFCFSWH